MVKKKIFKYIYCGGVHRQTWTPLQVRPVPDLQVEVQASSYDGTYAVVVVVVGVVVFVVVVVPVVVVVVVAVVVVVGGTVVVIVVVVADWVELFEPY